MLLSAASVSPQGVWQSLRSSLTPLQNLSWSMLGSQMEEPWTTMLVAAVVCKLHCPCSLCCCWPRSFPLQLSQVWKWEWRFTGDALLCLFCPRASKGCSLNSRLVLKLRLILTGTIAKTTENFLHYAFNLQQFLLFRVQKKAVPRCRIHVFPLLKLKENGLKGLNYRRTHLVSFLLDVLAEKGVCLLLTLCLCVLKTPVKGNRK